MNKPESLPAVPDPDSDYERDEFVSAAVPDVKEEESPAVLDWRFGKKEAVADSVEAQGQNEKLPDFFLSLPANRGFRNFGELTAQERSTIKPRCPYCGTSKEVNDHTDTCPVGKLLSEHAPKSDNAAGVSSPNSVPANAQGPMEEVRKALEQFLADEPMEYYSRDEHWSFVFDSARKTLALIKEQPDKETP